MKKILPIITILAFLFFPLQHLDTKVDGVFTTTNTKQVQVTVSSLSFRTGASTSHNVIKTLSKGTVMDVIGKIGNWYVVKNSKDTVGCLDGRYVKPYVPSSSTPPPAPVPVPSPVPAPTPDQPAAGDTFSAMQTEMLGYINSDRVANGLAPLTLTKSLSDGAYLKSKDMAVNDYFSHTSPTYGSPFDMMKSLGISYMSAGENIAMHTSIKGAYDAFMNSSGHRANILNAGYSKLGLGIYQEGSYLFITQWFSN